MIRFKWLTGDRDYLGCGGKWVSNSFRKSDHPAWFVVELINWENSVGEREAREVGARYNLSLSIVMPGAVAPAEMEAARRSCGWEGMPDDDLARVELLHSYGIYAQTWDRNGNNFGKLWAEMRREVRQYAFTFGFVLDRPVNAIGASGWDFLSGNPHRPGAGIYGGAE